MCYSVSPIVVWTSHKKHYTISYSNSVHAVCFIRSLFIGEGFRFLNFSILKASPSLIHRNLFINFQSARILCSHENFSNQCLNTFFSFLFLILSALKPYGP